jgi:hypothetical protein
MSWARHRWFCENYEEYSFNLCYFFTNDYFLLKHCISFAFEQHHFSHTNDYKRMIKFAFEYSFQRRARISKSNYMFFNIVYARNVNARVTKNRFRKRSSSEKNQFVESSLFRSSNSIIKEYDLVEENVTKEVSDAQSSIRKKWNDNDLTNHVSISKTMLRVFVWWAVRIFHFESNSWNVCFLFESKTWDEVTNVLVNVFVNQVRFRIEILEFSLCYSCDRFSLWFVSFVDIKESETTHLICSFHRRKEI